MLLSRRVSSMASTTRAAVVPLRVEWWLTDGVLWSEGCPVASVGAAERCRLLSGVEGSTLCGFGLIMLVSYSPLAARRDGG